MGILIEQQIYDMVDADGSQGLILNETWDAFKKTLIEASSTEFGLLGTVILEFLKLPPVKKIPRVVNLQYVQVGKQMPPYTIQDLDDRTSKNPLNNRTTMTHHLIQEV